jgi:hypothetical protein
MTKFVIDNSKKKHAFGQFFPPQGSPIALCQSFDGIGGITFISSSVRPPDAITRSSAAALEPLGRAARHGAGRHLASHIAHARFVELDGGDHWISAGDQQAVLASVKQFIGGLTA